MQIITKSEDEWKKALTPEEYRVLREKGTEAPFSGAYVHTKEKGMFLCAACGNELFRQRQSLIQEAGGPVFGRRLILRQWRRKRTRARG